MLNTRFIVALIIAILLDLADYPLELIPIFGMIAGTALDIIGVLILLPLIGKYALLPLLELIPLVDFVPTFTIAVWLARKEMRKTEAKKH